MADPGKTSKQRRAKGQGHREGRGQADAEAVRKAIGQAARRVGLAEFGDQALLIGGDAWPEILAESIRSLLSQRDLRRLPVSAFVVPHGGSRKNLSRELLELLECDKYLISSDGARFRHPDREAIARIIAYGRPEPNAPLKLVFNYRTEWTAVWADPALQQRYAYEAIYPQQGAGIKMRI